MGTVEEGEEEEEVGAGVAEFELETDVRVPSNAFSMSNQIFITSRFS